MKATGVVRRIDDLGRVVIPKEIRRTLRIKEGDPLEIFTDKEGEIILKKYSPIGELSEFASDYAETLEYEKSHRFRDKEMKATIDPDGFEVQRDNEGYIIPDDIEENQKFSI